CLNCCLDNYQMCIAVQDIAFAVSPIHNLKDYLENNLVDTDFLGIKIIGKPNILLRKNLGLYYVEINQNKQLFIAHRLCKNSRAM
uniref:hypothetical protein n=1 Tax=Legionella tunisiensis TaxID=1034944 RepID=UPI0005928D45